jgi:Tfp pilus assembly protein PilF
MIDVLYENAINWPGQRAIAAVLVISTLLVVIGLALIVRKRIWLGRGLGFVGFLLMMAALFLVHGQSNMEKPSESITIKRFRYTERTRGLVRVTMIVLPCAALAVMWSSFKRVKHRRRSDVPGHLKAGRRYFAQKDYETALREYNHAIQSEPQLGEAYCRRGVVYQAMGKTAEALSDFDRAIQCDSRLATAYLERGKMRRDSGDLDGALADFGHLILIRASDPDTYLQRGICLAKKGFTNDARADFLRVLKMTNHTDFAEPAKNYLRELEEQASRSPTSNNGSPGSPASPQPRVQDHAS